MNQSIGIQAAFPEISLKYGISFLFKNQDIRKQKEASKKKENKTNPQEGKKAIAIFQKQIQGRKTGVGKEKASDFSG